MLENLRLDQMADIYPKIGPNTRPIVAIIKQAVISEHPLEVLIYSSSYRYMRTRYIPDGMKLDTAFRILKDYI